MRTRDEIAADLAVPGPKTLDDLDAGGLWIQARHRLARDVPALLAALGVAEAALARVESAHSKLHGRCDNPICPLRAALAPTLEPPEAK